jgi:hypothetical protein
VISEIEVADTGGPMDRYPLIWIKDQVEAKKYIRAVAVHSEKILAYFAKFTKILEALVFLSESL